MCSLGSFHPLLELRQRTVGSQSLAVDTVRLNLRFTLKTVEVAHNVFGETELAGHEDSLAARELELGSLEGQHGVLDVLGSGSD